MSASFFYAFMLTTFAGLSTCFGSLVTLFPRRQILPYLPATLGFSAGVMLQLSIFSIIPQSRQFFQTSNPSISTDGLIFIFFSIGAVFALLLKRFCPEPEESMGSIGHTSLTRELHKTALLVTLAIMIHNFPEGVVVFLSSMKETNFGLSISLSMSLHNVPEGIAIAVPVYFACQDRLKTLWYTFLAGSAQPIGGVFAYLILSPYLNDYLFAICFALVAGVMTALSLIELLPKALSFGYPTPVIRGLLLGMFLTGICIWLFS